jgi:hypothetical protein
MKIRIHETYVWARLLLGEARLNVQRQVPRFVTVSMKMMMTTNNNSNNTKNLFVDDLAIHLRMLLVLRDEYHDKIII